MTIWGRGEDFLFWAFTGVASAVATGGVWLIRRVLTNQAQLEIVMREFTHRDQLRQEDREDMAEVKASVKRIENVLLTGISDKD